MKLEDQLKDFKKFLQSNPQLLKWLKISQLLNSEDLKNYSKAKLRELFRIYLENKENPFFCELPLGYVLGDVVVGNWGINPNVLVKLSIEDLQGHVIVAGATGSGKTNLILWILDQIQKQYED